ncbi:AlpA family transcriptional regulator [Methyloceanibacter sp. wino2]|uniref:helix-turn-helix transcriptional regulator n=1 Tax=Methyloceanibacter sp. wino2 TaxID=2170729 RepID=UPI000D3E62CE|nr:AlpA family phage regulatory protein [Methyloceanibacter sp. wino2]
MKTVSEGQAQLKLLGWDGLVAKGITASKPTIYRQIKQDKFPKPVYLGKSPTWLEHEIDGHIRKRMSERDVEAA